MTQFVYRENSVSVQMTTWSECHHSCKRDEDLNKGDSREQRREGRWGRRCEGKLRGH